jgi:hypothetical protein
MSDALFERATPLIKACIGRMADPAACDRLAGELVDLARLSLVRKTQLERGRPLPELVERLKKPSQRELLIMDLTRRIR